MTTNMVAIDERERAKQSLNEALAQQRVEINMLLKEGALDSVLRNYEVGERIKRIEAQPEIYGAQGAKRLAKSMGMAVALFYQCVTLINTFSRADIKKMVRKPMNSGGSLTMAHLQSLCTLRQEHTGSIGKMLKLTYDESLSAEALADEVQRIRGRTPDDKLSKRGRKMLPPRSPAAGLSQMYKLSDNIIRRAPLFEKAVLKPLKTLSATECTPQMVATLDAAIKVQEDLADTAITAAKELRSSRDRIQGILDKAADKAADKGGAKASKSGKAAKNDKVHEPAKAQEPAKDDKDDLVDLKRPKPAAKKKSPARKRQKLTPRLSKIRKVIVS